MNKEQVFEKFHEYEMKIGTRDVLITVRKEVGTEFYECKFNKGQKKDFINGYKGFGFNVSIVNDEVEFITKSTTLKNELNSKNWHNKKEIQFLFFRPT